MFILKKVLNVVWALVFCVLILPAYSIIMLAARNK